MALTVGELRVELGARIDELESALKRAEARTDRFAARAGRGTAGVQRGFSSLGSFLRGTFLPILASLGVAFSASEFLELLETTTSIRNGLRLVTDSAEELTDTFGALREIANDTRVPLDTTSNLFVRLRNSTEDLGISQSRVAGLTETINQTLALSGASAEQARNGLLQFGQGLAGGVLRAEEFNSIIENTPGLAAELAKGLGVSIGRLRQLVLAGEVTSKAIVEALENRAPEIARQFNELAPTISQAFTVVRNELLTFVDAINQSSGASELFSGSILSAADGLAESLGRAVRIALTELSQLVLSLADTIDAMENVGVTAGNLQEVFRTLFDTFNVVIQAIQTGFRTLQTGIAAIAASIQSLGNALGVVSDEAFAEGIADFERAQNALILSSEETETALSGLVDGILEVDSTAGEGPDTRLSDGVRSLAENIRQSAGSVEESVNRLQGARDRLSTTSTAASADAVALTKEQETTLNRILQVERNLNLQRLRAVDPLLAQRQQIENQILKLQEITGPQQIIEARDRAIAALRREQLRLTERQQGALEDLPIAIEEVQRRLEQLELLDPEAAQRFSDQLDAALEQGLGSEAALEKVLGVGRALSDALIQAQDEATLTFGEGISAGVREGISAALSGDFGGALQSFASGLQSATEESLNEAFSRAANQFGDLLDGVLPESLGGFGGLLTGIAGSAISAALQSDEVTSSVGNVQSAVTSAQQVRGVVAGPTNIAVADVGRTIQDAFLESERLLGIIAANTGRTAAALGGDGTAFSPGSEASTALANESASLI